MEENNNQLTNEYPNSKLIIFGINLIFYVINTISSENTLNKKNNNTHIISEIYKILDNKYDKEPANDDPLEFLKHVKDHEKPKLLEIVKKLLEILNPNKPTLLNKLYKLLFKANDPYTNSNLDKSYKKRIQMYIHKSLLENDPNINYITNITNNAGDSFAEIENAIVNLIRSKEPGSLPELKLILSELFEKNPKPFKTAGGKNKKRNKKTNNKNTKKHRNKTKKHR